MSLGLTVDALVERVRRDAHLGSYGPVYSLADDVLAGATQLMLNEPVMHITKGSIVAVDTELYRVQDIHHDSNMIDVLPGAYGSTTAAHTMNTLVEQDPRLPKASLLDWAEHEIRSWNKLLFRITALDLTASRTERAYDLAGVTEIDYLLEVRQQPEGTSIDGWGYSWSGDTWPHVAARLLRDMNTSEFASGFAVQLSTYPRRASTLRVVYARPFDLSPFTLATDLVTDVGLQPEWLDILENGLRWGALTNSMVSRTDWRATGMARDSEEVTLLDLTRAVDMARSQRDRRLNEEALNIRAKYPYRSG